MPNLIAARALSSLLFFLIVSSVSVAAAQAPSSEVVARVKRAVVLITTYDNQGKPRKQGSGFFLSPERVVTNLHVIDSASEIRISTFAGRKALVESVLATDKTSDLALLQLTAPCSDVATLGLEDAEPQKGEPVIVVSNPRGSHWQVTVGEAGPIWDFFDIGERLQITAGVLPGSSGGPVLNLQGRVIGIAAMHTGSADDLNFAVPAARLKTLQTTVAMSTLSVSAQPRSVTPASTANR